MNIQQLKDAERVPFRGTHYVQASALDSALEEITRLSSRLNEPKPAPEPEVAPDATEEEDTLNPKDQAVLEEIASLLGKPLPDIGPADIRDALVKRNDTIVTLTNQVEGLENEVTRLNGVINAKPAQEAPPEAQAAPIPAATAEPTPEQAQAQQ